MSWTPPEWDNNRRHAQRSSAPRHLLRRRPWLVGGGALLAINAAVIYHHGAPWQSSGQSSGQSSWQSSGQSSPPAAVPQLPAEHDRAVPTSPPLPPAEPVAPTASVHKPLPSTHVETITLRSRQAPAQALADAGVEREAIVGALESLQDMIDFRRMHPGDIFKAFRDDAGVLQAIEVHRGYLQRARAVRQSDGWVGVALEVAVDVMRVDVSGSVSTSLWDAVVATGEDPALVHRVVDVFAWEIDFYTEVRSGDTFRLIVEKRYAEGKFLGYGDVLAAEFVVEGDVHRGFLYSAQDGRAAYFAADGQAMKRQLLKSPLAYGHVTSGFGQRRHPVLGYRRKHNGVDYGVPVGTPALSVGDGRVMKAGWHGGFGRLVEVRHANGWVSQYAHLSKIVVTVGQRLRQRDVVGLVGSTGLATGPHLHYGLKRAGAYVNPQRQNFARKTPLAGATLEAYKQRVAQLTSELDKIKVARETAVSAPPKG